jgi:hypothetical protein
LFGLPSFRLHRFLDKIRTLRQPWSGGRFAGKRLIVPTILGVPWVNDERRIIAAEIGAGDLIQGDWQ